MPEPLPALPRCAVSKRHARHAQTAALVRYYQTEEAMSRRKARLEAHAITSSRANFKRWLDAWPWPKRCVTCDELRYTVVCGGCAACRGLYG